MDGKRRRETFISKRTAQRRAQEIEVLKGKGLKVALRAKAANDDTARFCVELLTIAGVGKPLTTVVEEYLAATKALGRGGGSLVEACEVFRRIRTEEGTRLQITVPDLVEKYRHHLTALERDTEYIKKCVGIYLRNFSRFFKGDLHTITIVDLNEWWATIKGSPRTRNNYRNAVEGLYSFARVQNYLERGKPTEASLLGKLKVT